MNNLHKRPDLLSQIYTNNGKSRRFKTFNTPDMYQNRKKLQELFEKLPQSDGKVISRVWMKLKTQESAFDTLTVRLSFSDETDKRHINSNSSAFSASINAVCESGFMTKISRGVYLVNPDYMHCLTKEQVVQLHNSEYTLRNPKAFKLLTSAQLAQLRKEHKRDLPEFIRRNATKSDTSSRSVSLPNTVVDE